MHHPSRGIAWVLGLTVLLNAGLASAAYSIRLDRFHTSGVGNPGGPYSDDFDDGALTGWVELFPNFQDEPGNSFGRFDSPGFEQPDLFFPNVVQQRSDIHSNLIPASIVASTGDFEGIAKYEAALPGVDETYFLVINYDNAGGAAATNGFIVGLTNYSPEYAALGGLAAGLSLWQFHWDYGPALEILNIAGFETTFVGNPALVNTVELGIHFTNSTSLIGGSYRFDNNNPEISPLTAFNIQTEISNGFWDIGVAEATIVPVAPGVVFFVSGLATLMCRRRSGWAA